jgi:phosphomevalonate kinase
MDRFISAPGKLFVSGEYAVLWGGTARVAAVAPRGQAYVFRREDSQVHLVLEEGRLLGAITPLGVRFDREVPSGFRFIAQAVDEVVRAQGKASLGFTLAMAPTAPNPKGHKLGLGSSARAALLAAEAARYVLEARVDPLKAALTAHAVVQGMRGSGADVAASYAGGLIRYRRFPVEAVVNAQGPRAAAYRVAPAVDLLRLNPAAWNVLYVHAGGSASTPLLIASAEQRLKEEARAAFVERSDVLGQELETAITKADHGLLSDALQAHRALLSEVGSLETDEAERALALAQAHGCAGKTSGAGGGDGCVVFCPDEGRAQDLLDAYAKRDIHAFAVRLEAGLRGEVKGDTLLRTWAHAA